MRLTPVTKQERDRARYATTEYRAWNRNRMRRMRATRPSYGEYDARYLRGASWPALSLDDLL